jgi:2-polyprenyl-3-methyl-5-hydroxy-6-metoxy-1,4-benzoquinol methylase
MNSLESINTQTMRAYNLAAEKYHSLFKDELEYKEYDRMLLDFFADKLTQGSHICDAGCGPSGHIGRYLANKGMVITGIDISNRCIELAAALNPDIHFVCEDISKMSFEDESFDAVVSYYSIIHTPKNLVHSLIREFYRVLKPEGILLVVVKAGSEESIQNELIGIETNIMLSLYSEGEIRETLIRNGFDIFFIEKRNPYDFEIKKERIFVIGRKI